MSGKREGKAQDVWMVVHGEYSSYYVSAVFLDEDRAKKYAAASNANEKTEGYDVERVDFEPPLPEIVRRAATPAITTVAPPQPMTDEERNALVNSLVLPKADAGNLDCGRE